MQFFLPTDVNNVENAYHLALLPEHSLNPSPVNPTPQVQPEVVEQTALVLHPSLILENSLTSGSTFIVTYQFLCKTAKREN